VHAAAQSEPRTAPVATAPEACDPVPKVTVVVPVYNPGPYIEDCIKALLGQSLSPQEYEVIFVDDGSTDESPERLDRLAAEHPHIRVIHQENSGWPGKPRNVGIDNARGEYVFFNDQDDMLGEQALERMYDFAKEHGSDIVIGKMAGQGRGVPRELFRRTYPKATLETAPLIDSLTPHKLFRKAFLDEHGLRFPEGRRRLEDHVFVTAAYFAATTISVLSDYVCYYHIRRDDKANAGYQRLDPKGYFANLCEALDIVEANTEPGPLRDRLYRRWYRVEMVERLRGRRLLQMPDADRRELLQEIRRVVGERFGPGVAAGLATMQRIVGAIAQAGLVDDLVQLAQWEDKIGNHVVLHDMGWHAGALRLSVSAELRSSGEPLTFVHRAGRDLLAPPLSDTAREALTADDLDCTTRLGKSRIDVILRSRETSEEHFVPVTFAIERHLVQDQSREATGSSESSAPPAVDQPLRMVIQGVATVDVMTAAGGRPLPHGVWDVVVRLSSCGWTKDARLGAVRSSLASRHCVPAILGDPPVVVTPFWTEPGNLSLEVGTQANRVPHTWVGPGTASVTAATGEATQTLTIPLRVVLPGSLPVTLCLVHEPSQRGHEITATLVPAVTDGLPHAVLEAKLEPARLGAGRHAVHLRLREGSDHVQLPATVTVPDKAGTATVEVLASPDTTATTPDPHQLRHARLMRTGRRLARRLRRGLAR
jgi:glycosyltransferase involved in cell wall biosynthesis